jgi:RNA polymerase primary sigma factor
VKIVRVPSYMVKLVSKWKFAENEASQRLGRKPGSDEVIAEEGGSEPKRDRLKQAMAAAVRCAHPISLDTEQAGHEVSDRSEGFFSEETIRSRIDREEFHGYLRSMGPREMTVLRFRFGLYDGEPMTLGAVGRRLHITRERVRQIEKAALEKLQSRMTDSMDRRLAPMAVG